MTEEDNRIDDAFKRKLSATEVEFREEDWIKARKLIDADRRNRKNRFFLLFFILLSLLSIGTTWFLRSNYLTTKQPTADTAGNDLPVSLNTSSLQDAALIGLPGDAEHTGHTSQQSHKPAKANNTLTTEYHSTGNGEQPGSRKAALLDKQQGGFSPLAGQRKKRTPKPLPANEDMSVIMAPASPSGSMETDADHYISLHKTADVILISSKANSPFFNVSGYCDTCQKTTAAYLANHNRNRNKNSLSVEAGLNYYNNGAHWYTPVNFHCGLLFSRYVSPRVSLHTGVLYTRINQDLPVRNFSATDYTFGALPVAITIRTNRLDYIEIPLSIGFNITPKHMVSAGASYFYLLQSADLVTTYDATGSSKEQKDNGHVSVFSTDDIQAHFSYRYIFNRYLYASAGYYMGLTDITNDARYGIRKQDKNSGLRLSIGFNLW